ncbi:oligosaccharide flippase family protein [Bacillus aquiflavi]|uniref:lipopolysaccharide biosynthesis protein n=1 Tax=Bacillus aquiflavi TaxID=2672567 RepID=UPI001CA7ECE8|nr:oligosaccharide flippase family protein [Bacillus aquiflavi]UAC47864.1 oligosaccharide flippase family protein [Bacillus aquiflavi]
MAGNKLFSKFLSFSFGSWVALGIGVISTPIITRLFSPKDFGLGSMYVLFFNIIVLVSLLGTDQAFVRFFYVEEENHRAVLLKKCIRMTIVAFILSSIVILFFSKPLSLFMFNQDSTFLILLVLLGALFQIIYRFSTLVIRMEQKGLIYSIVQIAAKILELLGVLLFVFLLGSSFHTYIYSYLFWLVIAALLTVFLTRHYWFSNRQKTTLKTTDKEIIYFLIPLVFTSLIYWLMQSIDRFALKAWASAEELGLYVAAFKVIALLNIFQTTFSTFWSPVSYDHYEKNPNDKVFYTKKCTK